MHLRIRERLNSVAGCSNRGQADNEKNEEGFKTATVSNYLASKYKWEEVKQEEKPKKRRQRYTCVCVSM